MIHHPMDIRPSAVRDDRRFILMFECFHSDPMCDRCRGQMEWMKAKAKVMKDDGWCLQPSEEFMRKLRLVQDATVKLQERETRSPELPPL